MKGAPGRSPWVHVGQALGLTIANRADYRETMHVKRTKAGLGMGWAFIALLVAAVGAGCGSGDDNEDDGGGSGGTAGKGSGGSGNSTGGELCGAAKCPAGQYCVNGVSCTPGCTSNNDCASNQTCANIDDVTHVGTCQNVATKDCAGYLTKCQACNGGELCTQQVCDAYSLECVNCIAASNCDDSGDCPCG